ncbi:MAG: class I SAM-dependent methyltransferase [Ilumatobacteraceae bacterium]
MSTEAPGPAGNHHDKYGATNPIERRMMAGFLAALDSCVDGLAPTRLLEVGVGEGEILTRMMQRFPAATAEGLDLPDDRLQAEWAARGLPARVGDATALEAADDAYDLVLAIEVLEHIPQPERALRELARVCTGHVVLSVPFEPIWRVGNMARGRYLRQLGNTPGHVNHWSRWSFVKLVGQYFEVEKVVSPLPWTMVRARSK